jgi:hypothetical protein
MSPSMSVCMSCGVRMLAAPEKALTSGAAAVPFRAASAGGDGACMEGNTRQKRESMRGFAMP